MSETAAAAAAQRAEVARRVALSDMRRMIVERYFGLRSGPLTLAQLNAYIAGLPGVCRYESGKDPFQSETPALSADTDIVEAVKSGEVDLAALYQQVTHPPTAAGKTASQRAAALAEVSQLLEQFRVSR